MGRVTFFKKNKMDLDFTEGSITITDGVADDSGQDVVHLLRNRNNTSGWMTTGSDDSADTELIADMGSGKDITRIILVEHNFKAFTIKYLDDDLVTWLDFSTPVAETVNADTTSIFEFDSVNTEAIQIIIDSTQIVDADKRMTQLIVTEQIGALECEPVIQPKIDRSRKVNKFLSGKVFISRSLPSFETKIKMNNVVSENDLDLIETLQASFESFLVWLSGGDEAQYDSVRVGYRLQDIFLCNVDVEYMPSYEDGHYAHGVPISIGLQETN